MENPREDIAGHSNDWWGGRCMDWDADVPTQDETYVIPDTGTVVCSSTCVDDNKIHKPDVILSKS